LWKLAFTDPQTRKIVVKQVRVRVRSRSS